MSPAPACSPPVRLRPGLSPSGSFCLLAVIAVLVVVSLPRLRGIALQENEVDARATAALLAHEVARLSAEDGPPPIAELVRSSGLSLTLSDVELLEDGALLRRHGYLFQLVRLPLSLSFACATLTPDTDPRPSGLAVRAWPWKHGATGSAAFLVTEAGAVYTHPNQPVRWEGVAGRETHVPGGCMSGWRPLP